MSNDPAYAIVGDMHGNLSAAIAAMDFAKSYNVKTLFQLGDWGFMWHGHGKDRLVKLNMLASELRARGQHMYFIDGNHDWHPELRSMPLSDWPNTVTYCKRGSYLTLRNTDGKDVVVGFMGGAASIDKKYRIEGVSWWHEEVPTDHDIPPVKLDVLMTHDAPELPPGLNGYKFDDDISKYVKDSRDAIAKAVELTKPSKLFHGHYHMSYRAKYVDTAVYGLHYEYNDGSIMIVDSDFNPAY